MHHNENLDIPIYQNNFINFNIEFLEKVLDLDSYTISYMKNKRYPCVLSNEEDKFENCSFIKNYPNHPYIFYKFKNITIKEFDLHVCNYLHDFFNNINGKEMIILDQLFSVTQLLNRMNFYMNENPIKEICVFRDPRDEYVNLWRDKYNKFKDSASQFIKRYNRDCIIRLKSPSGNRLCIRFEDMVMDYENQLQKINDFLNLAPREHIFKKQIFIPEKSKVNVGEYKEFHGADVINDIEQALSEYCYNKE